MSANPMPMLLTLRIKSYAGRALSREQSFGLGGGTLGRSPECDLVLDDPSKYISRLQARISLRNGSFVYTEIGANSCMLNGAPLNASREAVLVQRDQLVLGDYAMEVLINVDDPTAAAIAPPAMAEPRPPSPPLLGAPGTRHLSAVGGLLDGGAGKDELAVAGATDPLGLNLFGGAIDAPPRAAGMGPNPGAYRGAESDHIAPENQLLRNMGGARGTHQPIPENYDPLRGMQSRKGPAAAAGARQGNASDDEVVQALLSGLGLPHLQTSRSAVDLAQLMGSMLREATVGTMGALLARSLTKRESRIEVTMLAQQANNPLKFFPDADGALKQMLTGDAAGYMTPVRAMANAFDDLRAHELAVISAMRAAMTEVLKQVSPDAIEKQLQVDSAMDKVFSSSRKSRLWDSLVKVYEEITEHANDDFERYFSEKFSLAYEDQINRIRRASRK